MYLEIAMLAYFVVLFLTLRDIRIFKRTGYRSYSNKTLRACLKIKFGYIIGIKTYILELKKIVALSR